MFFCTAIQNSGSNTDPTKGVKFKTNPLLFKQVHAQVPTFPVTRKPRMRSAVAPCHPKHQSRAGSWLLPGSPCSLLLEPREQAQGKLPS